MKAEDTVMSNEELQDDKYDGLKFDADDIEYVLEAQAKISFKTGIKEVVEWGYEQCPHAGPIGDDFIKEKRFCNACWQAQLKEWGID